MSVLFGLVALASPLFSWGDSLYLDAPRLGKVDDYDVSGRTCHWVYTDIAVMERNSASRWDIGLRPIPLAEQRVIDELVETAAVDSVPSEDLEETVTYWIGGNAYQPQHHQGPWQRIEGILAGLEPAYTVEVRSEPLGAGARAVRGTFYCGENAVFRSASGTYEIPAPPASAGVAEYIKSWADARSISVEQVCMDGILYLQGGFPLFFYVMGDG